MKRGRKAQPCPSYDEVYRLHLEGLGPTEIANEIGAGNKAVRRWLGEIGIELKVKKHRPRGVVPAFVRVVTRTLDGKRISPKLYSVWHSMRTRCQTPGDKDYVRYGARGIRVCDAWQDYDVFRAWAVSHGYRKGLTLDREDSDGDYEPDNCRWIPKGEQQANIRRAIMLTLEGVTRSLYVWSRLRGISPDVIRTRVYNGWNDEHALTIPVGGRRPAAFLQRPGRKPRLSSEGERLER